MQMANKMQIRRDSATNWTSTNPTLSQGEMGYELNTGKLKIGNGIDAWVDLDYFDDQNGSYNDLRDLPFSDPPHVSDIANAASETYVNNAITALKAGAGSALDTLNELATALGNDANFSSTMTTQLGLKANSASLSTVATTGVYADLLSKPVLFDGAYNSLTGKPTLFSGDYDDLTHKPTLFNGVYTSLTGRPTLATVATSGAYADLSGVPRIPVYADDTARNTAIPTPAQGMMVLSNNTLQVWNGSSWINV